MLVDQDWTPETGHPITNFRISCTAVVIVDKVMKFVFLQAGIIIIIIRPFCTFYEKTEKYISTALFVDTIHNEEKWVFSKN